MLLIVLPPEVVFFTREKSGGDETLFIVIQLCSDMCIVSEHPVSQYFMLILHFVVNALFNHNWELTVLQL